ncbi:hypothetical protein N9558_03270, partial [Porticoccaceae bacterium]|nr:hypothetical protein [Porticoccaceae bacterium]
MQYRLLLNDSFAGSKMNQYFYSNKGVKQSLFTMEEVSIFPVSRDMQPDTLIWFHGVENWIPAIDLPQFTTILGIRTKQAIAKPQHEPPSINSMIGDKKALDSEVGSKVKTIIFVIILCLFCSASWSNCIGDCVNGQGTHTWPDGRKYVGQFKDGRLDGQGTFTMPDGRKYVGRYKDGRLDGQGTHTWPDGQKYVGQ